MQSKESETYPVFVRTPIAIEDYERTLLRSNNYVTTVLAAVMFLIVTFFATYFLIFSLSDYYTLLRERAEFERQIERSQFRKTSEELRTSFLPTKIEETAFALVSSNYQRWIDNDVPYGGNSFFGSPEMSGNLPLDSMLPQTVGTLISSLLLICIQI